MSHSAASSRRAPRVALALFAACAVATPTLAQQCLPDAFEPNEDCVGAALLGPGTWSNLTIPDNGVDVYRVTVPAGQRLVATLVAPNPGQLLGIFRISLDAGPGSNCTLNSPHAAFEFIELGETQATIAWSASATAPTDMFVRFDAFLATCVDYSLDLQFVPEPCVSSPLDAFEPNSSCTNTALLPAGSAFGLEASIADPDFYAVTVAPGELATLTLGGLGASDVATILAWDVGAACGDSNTVIAGTTVYGSPPQPIHVFNPSNAPRSIVVQVAPVPEQDTQSGFCVGYSLALQSQFDPCGQLAGDVLEPNDSCANPPVLTSSQSALNISAVDSDWFTLQVPPRSTVRVLATSATGQQRAMQLRSGCNGSFLEALTSSWNVYSDTSDPRQFLSWTNTATQPFDAKLHVFSPLGAGAFCDNYALELGFTLGVPFCPVKRNSTGEGARMSASGSTTPGVGVLQLEAAPLPPNKAGLVIMSRSELAATPFAAGYLCLGAPVVRLPLTTTGSGTLVTALNWSGASSAIAAGDTWVFQTWFRDAQPNSPGANLSEGLRLSFP
jgi:hypothetical protein